MSAREAIACLGAGRMARGIAVVFAYAGHDVTIVDVKARDACGYAATAKDALREVGETLRLLAELGLYPVELATAVVWWTARLDAAALGEALGALRALIEDRPGAPCAVGGALSGEQLVSEQYLLDLEREAFLSLCGDPRTQARMAHMLKTGKPLRN